MISHLNAKLILSTLEKEKYTFCKPQIFAQISVTFLFTSNTHFYSTFAFSDIFLSNQAWRLFRRLIKLQIQWNTSPCENYNVVLVCIGMTVKRTMYQRKVNVDMPNAVKSVLADVLSVSPSSEQRTLCQLTHSLRCSAYPHQPCIDIL